MLLNFCKATINQEKLGIIKEKENIFNTEAFSFIPAYGKDFFRIILDKIRSSNCFYVLGVNYVTNVIELLYEQRHYKMTMRMTGKCCLVEVRDSHILY